MAETRRFKMHPKLLLDVIQKQAGSLAKAILEGAMNAVDAGATRFDITVDEETVMMEDDGKGFGSRKEVEDFFEVFGQPHEEGDAHYGQFRMGRGQIFSYGHNFWRTGNWAMTVDVKEKGLEYRLEDMKKDVKGCQILVTLYDKLSRLGLRDTKAAVQRFVRYLEIPVFWHQETDREQLSLDPAQQKWDYEDANCYIKFKETGSLDIYNMGVHVKTYDRWCFGTGGVVVSRKPLEVNFARNDIQSTCEVWKRVRKIVDKRSQDSIKKKPLDDAARGRLAMQLHGSEDNAYRNIKQQRLITDCCGKHITLMSFMDKIRKMPVSHAPRGNRTGDRIMQTGIAYVLADETLDRFGVDSIHGLVKLVRSAGGPAVEKPDIRELQSLAEQVINSTNILTDKELKPSERLWIRIASWFPQGYHQAIRNTVTWQEAEKLGLNKIRKFKIGVGAGLKGWTDGKSYIALERDFLSRLSYASIGDITMLGNLILHELCHLEDDQEVSAHDPDFYERYHDNSDMVGVFVNKALANVERDVGAVMKKTNRALNALLDRKDSTKLELEAFDKLGEILKAGKGAKMQDLDFSEVEARLVAAETIRKQPKKKARKIADLGFLK
jgi:hypothetical protein